MSLDETLVCTENETWRIGVHDGRIYVSKLVGAFGLPGPTVTFPPAVHVSVCRAVKKAARSYKCSAPDEEVQRK